jgi:hypothetical protein
LPLSGQGSTTSTTRHNSPDSQNLSLKSPLSPRNLRFVRFVITEPTATLRKMFILEPHLGQRTYDLPTGTFLSWTLDMLPHFEHVIFTDVHPDIRLIQAPEACKCFYLQCISCLRNRLELLRTKGGRISIRNSAATPAFDFRTVPPVYGILAEPTRNHLYHPGGGIFGIGSVFGEAGSFSEELFCAEEHGISGITMTVGSGHACFWGAVLPEHDAQTSSA